MSRFPFTASKVLLDHQPTYYAWKKQLLGKWLRLKPQISRAGYEPLEFRHKCTQCWTLCGFGLASENYWKLPQLLGLEAGKEMQEYMLLYAQLQKLCSGFYSPEWIEEYCNEEYWVGTNDSIVVHRIINTFI